MPICSAVVLVAPREKAPLLAWLGEDPRFTVGPHTAGQSVAGTSAASEQEAGKLALVLEGDSTAELTALLEAVAQRREVQGVLPVFHAFEDEPLAGDGGGR